MIASPRAQVGDTARCAGCRMNVIVVAGPWNDPQPRWVHLFDDVVDAFVAASGVPCRDPRPKRGLTGRRLAARGGAR